MKNIIGKGLAFAVLVSASSAAFALSETFPDPFDPWEGRWFGANSNAENYYGIGGGRGNNPEGLWISDGGPRSGPVATITFNPGFGASLTSFGLGFECFVTTRVTIYDMSDNVLGTAVFSGGDFGFGHEDRLDVTSTNGVSKFVMDSTGLGDGQIEGNTSIDNIEAAVPEPGSFLALGAGALVLALRRRK